MSVPVNTPNATGTLGLPTSNVPLVDPSTGKINQVWWRFFGTLYDRVGGPVAPSLPDIVFSLNTASPVFFPEDVAQDEYIIPGLAGAVGPMGVQGPPGQDGQDGEDNSFMPMPALQNSTFNTISMGGTITPSSTAGVVGTKVADNANAGSIGENITPANLTSVALTSASPFNVSSVLLTPGDYDISGIIRFAPAATTVPTSVVAGISTTSGTFGAFGTYTQLGANMTAGSDQCIPTPTLRMNVSTTTTINLVAQMTFTVSSATATGFLTITRRRR